MTKQKQALLFTLLAGMMLPMAAQAHHYQKTQGYQWLLNWSNSLNGVSFNDQRYTPYCNKYAQVSANQARLRQTQQCASNIPTPTPRLKDRWNTNQFGHKGWCMSVSSGASRNELISRENGLKNCLRNHAPNNAQIRQNCRANDNLHKMAARGDINFVRRCLNAGTNVNSRERNNWTPLHSAARNGRLSIAKLLMQRGASINARDVNGRTPLDQAIAGNYQSMRNYLRNMGGVRH